MRDVSPNDPYAESGSDAVEKSRSRMKANAIRASFEDADQLEQRGHLLIARSRRMSAIAGVIVGALILLSATLLLVCYHAYDGTQDGLLVGNWAMLGALVSMGATNFAWAWLSQQRRLAEVGRNLIARADYQRKLAAMRAEKAEGAT
ncbi:MAG: hypothetical protein H6839_13605 [Planctomycetes bacterium]|nr:hypothetical protein [Planctomycetota bacterium]